jgi:hypothetical protein
MATSLREQASLLALVRASPKEWYRTAAVIADNGSAVRRQNAGCDRGVRRDSQAAAMPLAGYLAQGGVEENHTEVRTDDDQRP